MQSIVLYSFLAISVFCAQVVTPLCSEHCQCLSYFASDPEDIADQDYAVAPSLEYSVSCIGVGLKDVPENINQNVTHLYLSHNHITRIALNSFVGLTNLKSLILSSNKISFIEDGSFVHLNSLEILDLTGNRLSSLGKYQFGSILNLNELLLTDNPITEIATGSLDNLASLSNLHLSGTLLRFPPIFTFPSHIVHLYMDYTNIRQLSPESFQNYNNLYALYLKGAKIDELPDDVFSNCQKLTHLLMEHSHLKKIAKNAFRGLQLHTLMLQGTSISSLPSVGLSQLMTLNIQGVTTLWSLHAENYPNIRRLFVNYEFLCCPFKDRHFEITGEIGRGKGQVLTCNNSSSTKSTAPPLTRRAMPTVHQYTGVSWETTNITFDDFSLTLDPCDDHALPSDAAPVSGGLSKGKVICLPRPDDFNPCEDLLGSNGLRFSTWFIAILATIGNLITLIVLAFNRRKVSNQKLLTFVLAFSNLCMGLYLIILVAIDTGSRGRYNKYAREWQHGNGCKVSGFLSIFSTELSVFTLNIITLERYYTIVYPMQQHKWLKVRQTAVLLIISFIVAVILAVLPLTGVSSYSKVAICLPFDVNTIASQAYVTFLLASNGLSFFVVLICYVRMYLSIQHSNTSISDLNIAKKMALLVLTNFSCWAPIALFALLAVYGKPLIDVATSKFFLVFVFPINAFTNPFLYFLGTSRFRNDCRGILVRFRLKKQRLGFSQRDYYSSVRGRTTKTTRVSIGRWRHRSNSASSNGHLMTTPSGSRRTSNMTNQSTTPRPSIPIEPERRSSIFRNTFTALRRSSLEFSKPRAPKNTTFAFHANRRKSYDLAAKNNNMLADVPEIVADLTTDDMRDILVEEQKQRNNDVEDTTVFESAC